MVVARQNQSRWKYQFTLPSLCDTFGSCPHSLQLWNQLHCLQLEGAGSSSVTCAYKYRSINVILSFLDFAIPEARIERIKAKRRVGTHAESFNTLCRWLLLDVCVTFWYAHDLDWVTKSWMGKEGKWRRWRGWIRLWGCVWRVDRLDLLSSYIEVLERRVVKLGVEWQVWNFGLNDRISQERKKI